MVTKDVNQIIIHINKLTIKSLTLTSNAHENQRDSFYSDSDSDSDADEKTRKIHVEIKPAINDGSIQNAATVDEIKKSLGNLTLSPPAVSIAWIKTNVILSWWG